MGEFDRIQQEIYSIVMDGAAAPKPDEDDYATMLLWYEAQISHQYLGADLYKRRLCRPDETIPNFV